MNLEESFDYQLGRIEVASEIVSEVLAWLRENTTKLETLSEAEIDETIVLAFVAQKFTDLREILGVRLIKMEAEMEVLKKEKKAENECRTERKEVSG